MFYNHVDQKKKKHGKSTNTTYIEKVAMVCVSEK